MARSTRAHALSESRAPQTITPRLTFEDIGVRAPIAAAVHEAFPNVKYPTKCQAEFIPAVLDHKDVLLKDDTGTGKSFGLIVALLSKPRVTGRNPWSGEPIAKKTITSLVIVPHRDLAFQMQHWIERMVNAAESPPPLDSISQVLVRDGGEHLTTGVAKLQATPPHILIGTPQALLDLYWSHRDALRFPRLSTVVVDEVDYLIDVLAPNSTGKWAIKNAQKLKKHPGMTRALLDYIYDSRRQEFERSLDYDEEDITPNPAGKPPYPNPLPQLIMTSATLQKHLKFHLHRKSGWFEPGKVTNITGSRKEIFAADEPPPSLETLADQSTPAEKEGNGLASGIKHYVLVVHVNGQVENIDGAKESSPEASVTAEDEVDVDSLVEKIESAPQLQPLPSDLDPAIIEKFLTTPTPFKSSIMETIAATFALDVPSIALLVIPANAPLQRVVWELRELGVNAHGLDLLSNERGRSYLLAEAPSDENPTLLVGTNATIRGLDLPDLTHVFSLGIPEGPKISSGTVSSYLHIAGRVGRFGRGGKMITVVEKGIFTNDDVSKMHRILRSAGVQASKLEHFE